MNSQSMFEKGKELFQQGKLKESIDAFTTPLTSSCNDEVVLLSRGVAYLKCDNNEMSIKDFNRVINLNDNNVRAHYYKGMVFLLQGKFEESIIDFNNRIELKPDFGAAFFARGAAYAHLGDEYEAVRNIQRAITFSPANMKTFADEMGIFKTEFVDAVAFIEDRDYAPGIMLSNDEMNKVRKWLEDDDL